MDRNDARQVSASNIGRLVEAIPSALVLAFETASAVLACVLFSYSQRAEFIATNALPPGLLNAWVAALCAAFGIATTASLAYAFARGSEGCRRLTFLSQACRPLLLAWALPLLFDWRVFQSNEGACVALAALFGLGLERALRTSFRALSPHFGAGGPVARFASRCPDLIRRGPVLLVGILAVFFTAYVAYHSIHQHYMLKTQSIDMAAQENIVWNLLHGNGYLATPTRTGRTGSHLQDHAPFLAPLYAMAYGLRQKADTLLFLQAAVAGAAMIPLFLLARLKLGSPWAALAVAFAYMVHAPLHGALFYDFHYLTQAPFFVFCALYAFESGKRTVFVVAFAAALMVREDVSAGLALLFLFLLAEGRRPAWAFGAAAVSAVYFVAVKFMLMPAFATDSRASYTEFYAALIPPGMEGFGGVLATIFCNPVYTLGTLLAPEKFMYLLKTCGPVLFLPLRSGRTWLLLLVPALFTLLSVGYPPLVKTTFQYTSHWTAYLFPAAVYALARWREVQPGPMQLAAAAIAMALTAGAFSYQYGAIFQRNSFRGGFRAVTFVETATDAQNRADLYNVITLIPAEADVAATENEAPHVAGRKNCFTLRLGAQDAEYLLVNRDEIRKGLSRRQLEEALATGTYGFVASAGRYGLWRRGAPQRADEALQFLGTKAP